MMNLPIAEAKYNDLEGAFLHYTLEKNMPSIAENGLLPKIGANSRHIERTEKVFFAIGTEGFLMIMDVWLRWLTVQANIPKTLYGFGAWYMRNNFTPKVFSNAYLKSFSKSRFIKRRCCKILRNTLEESVVLKLSLREGEDFSYDDIDEAKDRFSEKSGVGMFYPSKSSFENKNIEYWNMHTFAGKIIPPEKISLLSLDGATNANEILVKLIKTDLAGCREKYPRLFEYYEYLSKLGR